ncbi:MAG: hypothetical protein H6632_11325 [Anaerolineales bacterium]|nr:hypothetical protein [Anaerolineales bacterium]
MTSGQNQTKIVAPVESGSGQAANVFVHSPLQIQSVYTSTTISRVELSVQRDAEPAQLIRADVPKNGTVTQAWTPDQSGTYLITTEAFNSSGGSEARLSIQVNAQPTDNIVSIPPPAAGVQTAGFQGPTPTPTANVIIARPTEVRATPIAQGNAAFQGPEAEIVVLDNQAVPSLTSTKPTTVTYPPPPPAPGVPWGPTQDQLPLKIPPVCDAAEFVGIYADTSGSNVSAFESTANTRREFIPGPDDLAKKVAGGTIVHRAWKLRNIGTCTWGPGYELAFYGGRSMGSGGVAFESTFPSDLRPRNQLIDTNRLILPEGKPNQIAVLEVLLNVPAYPGIHQSYWRMRNPQGIYFGPIIGVTMEVVRDCNQTSAGASNRIYGAPVVTFRILGVDGNLVGEDEGKPESGPLPATVGQNLTIDWSVFNITSFQLIVENPTGDIEVITTTDPRDRANFTPTIVGDYTLTLFAENGVCFIEQQITVRVNPPTEERFVLSATFNTNAPVVAQTDNIRFSSDVAPGTAKVEYEYYEDNASVQTGVNIESYEADWVSPSPCPAPVSFINCGGGYYTAWRRIDNLPLEISGTTASGAATLGSRSLQGNLPSEIESSAAEEQPLSIAVPPPGCRGISSPAKLYGAKYIGNATTSGTTSGRQIVSDNVKFICAPSNLVTNGTVPALP